MSDWSKGCYAACAVRFPTLPAKARSKSSPMEVWPSSWPPLSPTFNMSTSICPWRVCAWHTSKSKVGGQLPQVCEDAPHLHGSAVQMGRVFTSFWDLASHFIALPYL